MPVSVYKGKNVFLRVGPEELIKKEIKSSKELFKLGYPVAEILESGHLDGQYYFIENSLGEIQFSSIFESDTEKEGKINDEHFALFLDVSIRLAEAQIKTASKKELWDEFMGGIHLGHIINELPQLASQTKIATEKVRNRLKAMPRVMSHGDFNPYNSFPGGIIDIERPFAAPLGYDLASNIIQTFMFPSKNNYEKHRKYEFNPSQIDRYVLEMDRLLHKEDLLELSKILDDFIFLRLIWSVVRMEKTPLLQKWRYGLYTRVLMAYISNFPIKPLVFR